jgi:glycerol uptake facilitator-like aquaporin
MAYRNDRIYSIVQKIEGSANVMGMPVDKVYEYLSNLALTKNMSFFNDFTKEVIGTGILLLIVFALRIITSRLVRRFASSNSYYRTSNKFSCQILTSAD